MRRSSNQPPLTGEMRLRKITWKSTSHRITHAARKELWLRYHVLGLPDSSTFWAKEWTIAQKDPRFV